MQLATLPSELLKNESKDNLAGLLSGEFLERFENKAIGSIQAVSKGLIKKFNQRNLIPKYPFQLTNEYYIPREEDMLFNACVQLGNRDFLVVVYDIPKLNAVIYISTYKPLDKNDIF